MFNYEYTPCVSPVSYDTWDPILFHYNKIFTGLMKSTMQKTLQLMIKFNIGTVHAASQFSLLQEQCLRITCNITLFCNDKDKS